MGTMTTEAVELLVAVLRSRGKHNSLHDITRAADALASITRERDAMREALEPFAQTWSFSKDAPDARVTCSTENGVLDLPVSAFRAAFDAWSKAGGHAARDSAALVNGEGE